MFHISQQARKYSPTRLLAVESAPPGAVLQAVVWPHGAAKRRVCSCREEEEQEEQEEQEEEDPMSPPPGAKKRASKSNKGHMVRAVRRHPSPHNPGLGGLEEAWSQREHRHPEEVKPQRTPPPPEVSSPPVLPAEGSHSRVQKVVGPPETPGPSERAGQAEGPPRSRKRGYRAPHVGTIFSPRQRDPRVREERGEGHHFVPGGEGTWCDVCCDYILHLSVTCTGCKYTCHTACGDRVTLDCNDGASTGLDPVLSPLRQDHLNNNNTHPSDVEKERELRTQLSREEIRQKVDLYNSLTRDHLKMTLSPSGVYTGFIKVQLELRRPVTVRGARTAGSRASAGEEAFYLPRGATNTLHISSTNTVRQVIVALLNKFTVADNPAKYALYKRCNREEQVYVCRLAEGEQPLFLRLLAGPDTDVLNFVLREQHTGEVMWDAFSVPELRNFLRILEKEEQEQVDAIARRYGNYRQRLQDALRHARGPS